MIPLFGHFPLYISCSVLYSNLLLYPPHMDTECCSSDLLGTDPQPQYSAALSPQSHPLWTEGKVHSVLLPKTGGRAYWSVVTYSFLPWKG